MRKTVVDNPGADQLVIEAILEFMYVDDLTKSVDSISEVHKIITGISVVLQTGGFHRTKFVVNNETIMAEIPKYQS